MSLLKQSYCWLSIWVGAQFGLGKFFFLGGAVAGIGLIGWLGVYALFGGLLKGEGSLSPSECFNLIPLSV